jgi:hypothetical protein
MAVAYFMRHAPRGFFPRSTGASWRFSFALCFSTSSSPVAEFGVSTRSSQAGAVSLRRRRVSIGRQRSRRRRRSDTSAGSSVASRPHPCGQGGSLHGVRSIRWHGDPRQHGSARPRPERQRRPCVARRSRPLG